MDPINNPFSPGAGSPPPELVGRDHIIEQTRILLERIKNKRSEKSILLTGLRGVGKTVLLNEMEQMAIDKGYGTIFIEAHEGKCLSEVLPPRIRNLLYKLNRLAGAENRVRRGLAVLKSFAGAIKLSLGEIELGLDISPEKGTADSGHLEMDLTDLFIAVAEAAEDKHTPIAILIDEIQFFKKTDIAALIMAMHKMQQKQLPLILLAAGLPTLHGLAGEAKSYSERLFNFIQVGPLTCPDIEKAIQVPMNREGIKFETRAVGEIASQTHGYPYFIQEWGYQTWNYVTEKMITVEDIHHITDKVITRLDENFFRVRFDRLTVKEKDYLRAMVKSQKSSDVAAALGVKVSSTGPVRANLINKGMIYSPAHGTLAYTVPLFVDFLVRAMP